MNKKYPPVIFHAETMDNLFLFLTKAHPEMFDNFPQKRNNKHDDDWYNCGKLSATQHLGRKQKLWQLLAKLDIFYILQSIKRALSPVWT